jgi:predicted helicase
MKRTRRSGHLPRTFATLLSDKKIKVRHRLFMTATERVYRGDRDDVLSMDSEKDYGARFFQLSFKEAIKQKIITDYKILTMTVSDGHIRHLINQNRILNLNSRDLDEAETQSIAAGIAVKRIYKKHGIKHAISFHRSIHAADRFREQQDALNRLRDIGPKTTNLHISSKKTAGQRSDLLREFVDHKRALMTNARCLTEGVDVPAIDCVLFADPKQSRIDIVQAAGCDVIPERITATSCCRLLCLAKWNFQSSLRQLLSGRLQVRSPHFQLRMNTSLRNFDRLKKGEYPAARLLRLRATSRQG